MNALKLDRLPLRLTALVTALSAIGLAVLAGLAIIADADRARDDLNKTNEVVTSTVLRLQQYTDTLVVGYINQDSISGACPQFAIIQGGAGQFPTYYSKAQCVPMDPARLGGIAHNAMATGAVQAGQDQARDGRPVQVRAEPFRNKNGQYVGTVIAVTDAEPAEDAHIRYALLVVGGVVLLLAGVAVGSYLLTSRLLKPAVEALAQQEILLAETAHDLRNPVASLRALAETLINNPDLQGDLLPRTVKLSEQMGSIIESQLTRARLAAGVEKLEIQPVWLDQLVTGLVEDTPTDGAQVTVTAAQTKVLVDPDLIQRAVRNLLDNAVRYGRQPDEPAIVHITVTDGRVIVADHGPGVDAGIADDLLDRFRTGAGSTGLGLSIVSWIAQAHGGRLDVYNADEGGAIFELVLPAVRPAT